MSLKLHRESFNKGDGLKNTQITQTNKNPKPKWLRKFEHLNFVFPTPRAKGAQQGMIYSVHFPGRDGSVLVLTVYGERSMY